MPSPDDRKYSESHEWHMLDGETVTVGISRFAVDQLTDVTYVEMQPAGTSVGPGDALGEVESVKTTSDVYSAVAGEVIEVNQAVVDDPSLLNSDPYGQGWLVKIRATDASGLEGLADAGAYDEQNG